MKDQANTEVHNESDSIAMECSQGYAQLSRRELAALSWATDDSVTPISFVANYLTELEVSALLSESEGYPLLKPEVKVFGKWHKVPRTQVWFADSGCDYQYSGLLVNAQPWPKCLDELRRRVNQDYHMKLNGVLVNKYQNGKDTMGWHSDNEAELVAGSSIVSISLGARRDFLIRHRKTKRIISFSLAEGDLLIMHAPMQQHWDHCLPKRMKISEARLSLTFRELTPNYHANSHQLESCKLRGNA